MSEFEKARDTKSEEESLRDDLSIGFCIECFTEGANWARQRVLKNDPVVKELIRALSMSINNFLYLKNCNPEETQNTARAAIVGIKYALAEHKAAINGKNDKI